MFRSSNPNTMIGGREQRSGQLAAATTSQQSEQPSQGGQTAENGQKTAAASKEPSSVMIKVTGPEIQLEIKGPTPAAMDLPKMTSGKVQQRSAGPGAADEWGEEEAGGNDSDPDTELASELAAAAMMEKKSVYDDALRTTLQRRKGKTLSYSNPLNLTPPKKNSQCKSLADDPAPPPLLKQKTVGVRVINT